VSAVSFRALDSGLDKWVRAEGPHRRRAAVG